MLKHRRVKGYYFLFTLGFLLVFSSGFLAFLAWDGPGYQGSLAALEQPMTPPSLGSQSAKQTPQKETSGARPAATLESPGTIPPSSSGATAPQVATPAADVKAARQQSSVTVSSKTTKPALSEKNGVSLGHGVQSKTKIADPQEKKAPAAKPQKQSRKSRKNLPATADETKVPPEWNWFATPLHLAMEDHKVEIVSDLHAEEQSEPLKSEPQAAATDSDASKSAEEPSSPSEGNGNTDVNSKGEPASVAPLTTMDVHEAYSQRLGIILARLQERREKRAAEANARSLVLPSAKRELQTSASEKATSGDSSVDTGNTLPAMGQDVDSIPVAAQEGLPPMPSAPSVGETDK